MHDWFMWGLFHMSGSMIICDCGRVYVLCVLEVSVSGY